MLSLFLKFGKYANFFALALQLLNETTDAFPALKVHPIVLTLQGILAALTSGVFGLGHKAEFGETQMPAARSTSEIQKAAIQVTARLAAATPVGQGVTVPSTTSNIVAGTKV